jgi:hypothetical protein
MGHTRRNGLVGTDFVVVRGQATAPALRDPQCVAQRFAQPFCEEPNFPDADLPFIEQRVGVAEEFSAHGQLKVLDLIRPAAQAAAAAVR